VTHRRSGERLFDEPSRLKRSCTRALAWPASCASPSARSSRSIGQPGRPDATPGKSDPIDAEAAARAALAGTASASPKTRDGGVEAIRALRVARRSALKARTQAANQLDALVISAPEPLRGQLGALATAARVARVAALRCGPAPTDATAAAKLAMGKLAPR
jgi:hypothetical protein